MPASKAPCGDEVDEAVGFETVDWSCCCCSRRQGVQVLGGCFLALSVVVLALCCVELAAMPQYMREAALRGETRLLQGVQGLLVAQATLAALGAGAAGALLWGAGGAGRGGAPGLLLPWMLCGGAQVTLQLAAAVYCAAAAMTRPVPVLRLHGFFAFVLLLAACVPVLYCVTAVATFYRELRHLERGGRWRKVGARPATPPPPSPPAVANPAPTPAAPRPAPPRAPPRAPPPAPTRTRYGSDGHENPAFQVTAF